MSCEKCGKYLLAVEWCLPCDGKPIRNADERIQELEAENANLRAGLKRIQWCVSGVPHFRGVSMICPACGATESGPFSHEDDCWLAKLIQERGR